MPSGPKRQAIVPQGGLPSPPGNLRTKLAQDGHYAHHIGAYQLAYPVE
jgi:hypothetical protein